MNPSSDLLISFGLLSFAAALGIGYGLRVLFAGKARFDRTDREGGSALVSKGMMEMAYWALQPVGDLLIRFRITANGISFLSLGFGALAGVAISSGLFGLGGALSMVSALMDTLDGMVARKTGFSSDSGEVLDAAVDRYVEFFFLAGLMDYFRQDPRWFLLSAGALLGSFMVSYSTAKAEALQVTPPRGMMRRTERAVVLTLGAVLSPVFIGSFESTTPAPMLGALFLVALLSNASAIQRLRAIAIAVKKR